jgi:predicted lipoprotein
MPTANPRIKTTTQLDNHTVELQTKDNRAATIYNNLQTYDYDPATASHPMVSFSWKVPTTNKTIELNTGAGEMYYDGTGYSSLSSEQKVVFWQWIDKFVAACLKNYDKNYGF